MYNQEIKINASRNEKYTRRNTSRISNSDKIYNYLKKVGKEVSTTKLSENTKINPKNISRYLKTLESEGKIKRRTVQNGKKRFILVSLSDTSRNEIDITNNKINKDNEFTITPHIKKKNKIITSRGINTSHNENIRSPIQILTVNSIFEVLIEYTRDKKGKGYERINKILKSHDKNRNYQSNIIRDVIEILIEMRKVI